MLRYKVCYLASGDTQCPNQPKCSNWTFFSFLLGALTLLLCNVTVVVCNESGSHSGSEPTASKLSHKLSHSSFFIHASSIVTAGEHESHTDHLLDAATAAAAATGASSEDEQELTCQIFHKTSNPIASASFFKRFFEGVKNRDDIKQYFVRFSTPCDIKTLVALQKFSGIRVVSHVERQLYAAIGTPSSSAKSRRFPGVLWIQERQGSSKLGGNLQKLLAETEAAMKVSSRTFFRDTFAELVADCWFDGCGSAAAVVRPACPVVYIHPTMVEVHCPHHALHAAVSILSAHVAVDHVDLKVHAGNQNFGGRAIIGNGPDSATPESSLVLSRINVSGSIIAVADTGIDMNNCFFYDATSSKPWNNSRVLHSYTTFPCHVCGRCCTVQSGPNCTDAANSCGNFIDQDGHGTHVAGTVAGAGPDPVAYGNGIASGAKIFFQDFNNIVDVSKCYSSNDNACARNSIPTDLLDLFKPAYEAGARVHSNSWAPPVLQEYSIQTRQIDAFVAENPTFLILFGAGNDGQASALGTVRSIGTCKNCLSVGATQQSNALLRSMQPFVDDGFFCYWARDVLRTSNLSAMFPCCTDVGGRLGNSCVQNCCNAMPLFNASLPCCINQTTCDTNRSCSVESGNLYSATNIAEFSARGPTLDGRFKPDLVVPGVQILSAAAPRSWMFPMERPSDPDRFVSTSPNYCVVPSQTQPRSKKDDFDAALIPQSGTSHATPLVAGAVEKIRQYFVQGYYPKGVHRSGNSFEPEEALVRAVILASCLGVFTNSSWGTWSLEYPSMPNFFRYSLPPQLGPNFFQGFGLPVLDHAVYMAESTNGYRMYFTNGSYSSNSMATAYNISCDRVLSQTVPLTLALVWTDPPGNVNNNMQQLVNDLDLIVIVPGSNPSQFFGNMRTFADQVNTVERVVTTCPAAGVVTAIVAPGNLLKTSSQKWYLVANGPVISGFLGTAVPPYKKGRFDGIATQSLDCSAEPGIPATVAFNPSSAWTCVSQYGLWDCSVREREFAASLAQIFGVPVQAFGVTLNTSDSTKIYMTLRCSAMINTVWQNTTTLLKYVSAKTLVDGFQNVNPLTYAADPILSALNWSTFSSFAPRTPQVVLRVTVYDDVRCSIVRSAMPTNPLTFNELEESPGPFLPFGPPPGFPTFLQAVSCNSSSVSFRRRAGPSIVVVDALVGNCTLVQYSGPIWFKFDRCTAAPSPVTPPSPPNPTTIIPSTTMQPPTPSSTSDPPAQASSSNSATSTGVIAGSITGSLACKLQSILNLD
jgi:subtilisin family serine protease